MKFPRFFLLNLAAGLLFCSCQTTSTAPTAAEMDRYYQVSAKRAEAQVAALASQRDSGTITSEDFDSRSQKIQADVARKANEMAWAKHELAESEMRALGIPTGDHPVFYGAPALGGVNGSLYRSPGDPGANDTNQRVFNPPTTGFTPGQYAGMAANNNSTP